MNLKCALGFHTPDNNWILKFSSKVYFCNCARCGKYLTDRSKKAYTRKEFYNRF